MSEQAFAQGGPRLLTGVGELDRSAFFAPGELVVLAGLEDNDSTTLALTLATVFARQQSQVALLSARCGAAAARQRISRACGPSERELVLDRIRFRDRLVGLSEAGDPDELERHHHRWLYGDNGGAWEESEEYCYLVAENVAKQLELWAVGTQARPQAVDLLVVDRIQDLAPSGSAWELTVETVCRRLKQVARTRGVAVLAVSRLTAQEGRRQRFAHQPLVLLQGGDGAIEGYADTVLMHRRRSREPGPLEIELAPAKPPGLRRFPVLVDQSALSLSTSSADQLGRE